MIFESSLNTFIERISHSFFGEYDFDIVIRKIWIYLKLQTSVTIVL